MVANEGKLTVVVPDFYRGKVTSDYEEAGHLMSGLDWSGALQDIAGAATFLKSKGCKKVRLIAPFKFQFQYQKIKIKKKRKNERRDIAAKAWATCLLNGQGLNIRASSLNS